jgi:DNA helicase II / ATP-dependent DNA helicase PcrA
VGQTVQFDQLNEAQQRAVLVNVGPVMILAGAGSGKTRTLVSKISYLIENLHISPFQVLALTFSNKAAREMRERVAKSVSDDIGALGITTFHAFCARVLRSEASYIGLSQNFTIYDTSESKAIVKQILSRHGISTKEVNPKEILFYISEIKNSGYYLGAEAFEDLIDKSDPYYGYFTEYESELAKSNAVDFGGLINGVIQLLEKFPEVLKKYQERYKYLFVDEYQDTNRAQFKLLCLLAEKCLSVCVVGDEDQSIYSWRGADINNILDFEEYFPGVQTLKLEQNYRSSKVIIDAASCVIGRNIHRKGKEMWTDNDEGDCVEIIECHNDKSEAEFITDKIMQLKRENIEIDEVAVFYRTNAQSRMIEDSLRKNNIAYRVVGGVKFYERKEIKDLLAYIRVVVNEKDSLAFSRILNVPSRGIGTVTLRKLESAAIVEGISLPAISNAIIDQSENFKDLKLSAKVRSSLSQLNNLFNESSLMDKEEVAPSIIYEKLLHESGYYDFLKGSKDYESMARIENLEELGTAISQYEETASKASLAGFLETVTLDTSNEEEIEGSEDQSGEVSLMTIHGAKGLEFSYVFIAGAEENIFPSFRSIEEGGDQGIEEERRLFYVAMTRAMIKLYICFAQGRVLFGQLKFNGPSRFINEIPEKYYIWRKLTTGGKSAHSGFASNDEAKWDEFNQETSYDELDVGEVRATPSQEYKKGMKVLHSLYGQGVVNSCDGFGSDEKVVIRFTDGATKKFLVKFAPLTKY